MTYSLLDDYDKSRSVQKNLVHYRDELPAHITENIRLDYTIRTYQKEAFGRLLHYLDNDPPENTHLLFEMATGSGKTLVMAGIILHMYSLGYRNFLFFVNSQNIVAKTLENFCRPLSRKYLFAPVVTIDGQRVAVREVENFANASDDTINICFTTIQDLHGKLQRQSENSLTFEDFIGSRTVLISDEAHHMSSDTKRGKKQETTKPSWENTVKKVFEICPGNMLFEFTATLGQTAEETEKYRDKQIYKYDFKKFRADRYSKDIMLLKSSARTEDRMIHAIVLSQYRREIAAKYKVELKPVILFKAQRYIEESRKYRDTFHELIASLTGERIAEALDVWWETDHREKDIMVKAKAYFRDEYVGRYERLAETLQKEFAPSAVIFTNDDRTNKGKEKEEVSDDVFVRLNTLEDPKNPVRAIFTVNKLNEWWDVLNLFDIVRLYDGTYESTSNSKTTTSEAQLIGRGARYCPFATEPLHDDIRDQRKYDHDPLHQLRAIETIHYHSLDDSCYIRDIKKELTDGGFMDAQPKEPKILRLKKEFEQTELYQHGHILVNKLEKVEENPRWIREALDQILKGDPTDYPVSSSYGQEEDLIQEHLKETGDMGASTQTPESSETYTLAQIYSKYPYIVRKAIDSRIANSPLLSFDALAKKFPDTDYGDMLLREDMMGGLRIRYTGDGTLVKSLDTLPRNDLMKSCLQLLQRFEDELRRKSQAVVGKPHFEPEPLKKLFPTEKSIYIEDRGSRPDGDRKHIKELSWYVYDANFGTDEEKALVECLEKELVPAWRKIYDHVYLIRNERTLKIHRFKEPKRSSEQEITFEPDFVLVLGRKKWAKETFAQYQLFIEPKWDQSRGSDKTFETGNQAWKIDFLKELKGIKDSSGKYVILGFPWFYNQHDEKVFVREIGEVTV